MGKRNKESRMKGRGRREGKGEEARRGGRGGGEGRESYKK